MESAEKLAKAIHGLTIALWCWIGFQVLLYGSSMFTYLRATSGATEGTRFSSSTTFSEPLPSDPNEGYDRDFTARPMKDKVRLATAILIVEMKEIDGVHKAVVQEILKLQPGIRLYYKVGDDYDDLSHMPGEECDACTAQQRILVLMHGNPAEMRFSTTFEGDRIAGLGGMTLDELRKLAQTSPAASNS
jgi:hypothetical protein